MAVFNMQKRIIECKIVYYGPAMCGKTTNLETIYKLFHQQTEGDFVSIDTEGDRPLFFDFLPMRLGKIHGCDVRVQIFTVPGQPQYISTRKLVMKDADGFVFVADSRVAQRKKNMLSLKDLHENLKSYGLNILQVPLILQYNKRDLANSRFPVMSIEQMEKDLNRQLKVPSFAASALAGEGVGKTLKACIQKTLRRLQKKLDWAGK